MELIGNRVCLEPFSLLLIDAAVSRDYEKIKKLGYVSDEKWPEDDLALALPFFRSILVENGIDGFNSWLILDKNTRKILGSIGFIGQPDSTGCVEIGFGIVSDERRKGYCCEALRCLKNWAFTNDSVRCIIAKCEVTNIGSISVLEKTEFIRMGVEDDLIVWENRAVV